MNCQVPLSPDAPAREPLRTQLRQELWAVHSCIPLPTCPFYEAGMPTPLTISFCRLALLPTEATLADGAESVLLQLQWIDSPCTNLSTMRVPALRPRFQGRCESSPDLSISPVPRWSIALEPAILATSLGATRALATPAQRIRYSRPLRLSSQCGSSPTRHT